MSEIFGGTTCALGSDSSGAAHACALRQTLAADVSFPQLLAADLDFEAHSRAACRRSANAHVNASMLGWPTPSGFATLDGSVGLNIGAGRRTGLVAANMLKRAKRDFRRPGGEPAAVIVCRSALSNVERIAADEGRPACRPRVSMTASMDIAGRGVMPEVQWIARRIPTVMTRNIRASRRAAWLLATRARVPQPGEDSASRWCTAVNSRAHARDMSLPKRLRGG